MWARRVIFSTIASERLSPNKSAVLSLWAATSTHSKLRWQMKRMLTPNQMMRISLQLPSTLSSVRKALLTTHSRLVSQFQLKCLKTPLRIQTALLQMTLQKFWNQTIWTEYSRPATSAAGIWLGTCDGRHATDERRRPDFLQLCSAKRRCTEVDGSHGNRNLDTYGNKHARAYASSGGPQNSAG